MVFVSLKQRGSSVLCVVQAELALNRILQQTKGLGFLIKSKKVRRLLMLPQPSGSKNVLCNKVGCSLINRGMF